MYLFLFFWNLLFINPEEFALPLLVARRRSAAPSYHFWFPYYINVGTGAPLALLTTVNLICNQSGTGLGTYSEVQT